MAVQDMLGAHPRPTSVDREVLARCIAECLDCAAACTSCPDACLAEPDVAEFVRCIRLCLDCGDVCVAAARLVTRQIEAEAAVLRPAIEACAAACRASGDECERPASHHEHCRLCAESCRRCEAACDAVGCVYSVLPANRPVVSERPEFWHPTRLARRPARPARSALRRRPRRLRRPPTLRRRVGLPLPHHSARRRVRPGPERLRYLETPPGAPAICPGAKTKLSTPTGSTSRVC
jgi:hypothetical protein